MLLVIVACNTGTASHGHVRNIQDTVKHVKYPDTPNFQSHQALLFSFFERRKALPAFDTEISFEDDGFGPIDHYYNFIHAGHLFSKTQTHAFLFYDIAMKEHTSLARIGVYKKDALNASWNEVLDDTCEVLNYCFSYRDWNGDGINDLSYKYDGWENGGHGPISWHLYLTDKNGELHKVKGFEDIDDPQIDSFTNRIFSTTLRHTGVTMAAYKFSGNDIIKVSDDLVIENDSPDTVTYLNNGNIVKKRRLKHGQKLFVPKHNECDNIP